MEAESAYPGLYPPVEQELTKMEKERILYDASNAARELQEHREQSQDFSRGVLDGTVSTSASAPSLSERDINAILDEESEEEVEKTTLSLYEPSILAKWFSSLAARFSTGSRLKVLEFHNGRATGEAPSFAVGKPSRHAIGWQGMVGDKANTEKLKMNGLHNVNAAKLLENGIDISSFRTMRYEVTQMRSLFSTFEALQEAGFQAHHLCSCCWKLGSFAMVYGIDPVQLATRLNLSGQMLLRSGVSPDMLRIYNLNLEKELETTHVFDLAWKSGLSAARFCEAFNTDPNHLFRTQEDVNPKKLTVRKLSALACSIPGWRLTDLYDCGMLKAVASSAGLGVGAIKPKY